MQFQMQSNVETVGDEYDLGWFRQEFKPPNTVLSLLRLLQAASLVCMGPVVLIALLSTKIPFLAMLLFLESDPPPSSSDTFIAIGIAIFFFFGLPELVRISLYSWRRELKIYAYERGMIVRKGRRTTRVLRWDEIGVIWHEVRTQGKDVGKELSEEQYIRHTYRVLLRDGRTCTFPADFRTSPEFGGFLEDQFVSLELSKKREAYDRGEALSFGLYTLDQSGLSHDQAGTIPWNDIKEVGLNEQRGEIYLERKGSVSRFTIDTKEIPCPRLFQMVCKLILERDARE